MRNNMALLSLSFILSAVWLPEANGQQINVEPNSTDMRVVAEAVPKFDIEQVCRVDNTSLSLDGRLGESIRRCTRIEKIARDLLKSFWSRFEARDRINCIGETYDASGKPPSYVELSTCLQRQLFAKQLSD
jgi:hypothetical protein